MPPYWDKKSLPYTYPNPTRYFIFNFLIISLIFIENKCLSDAMRFEKGEKKFGKRRARTWVDCIKKHALPSMPLKLILNEHLFLVTNPITCWWAELVYIAFANKAGYLHLV